MGTLCFKLMFPVDRSRKEISVGTSGSKFAVRGAIRHQARYFLLQYFAAVELDWHS